MTRTTRLTAAIFVLTLLLLGGTAQRAKASTYIFVQAGTADILAILATDGTVPFTHANFLSFTFTTEGAAIFGFTPGTYTGAFTSIINPPFTVDGGGGLAPVSPLPYVEASGTVNPITPPLHTGGTDTMHISTRAYPTTEPDYIYLRTNPAPVPGPSPVPGQSVPCTCVMGTWMTAPTSTVPEPSTLALGLAGVAGLAVFLWRRRRTP